MSNGGGEGGISSIGGNGLNGDKAPEKWQVVSETAISFDEQIFWKVKVKVKVKVAFLSWLRLTQMDFSSFGPI